MDADTVRALKADPGVPDLGTFGQRRELDKIAAAVMLALGQLPALETITLGGRIEAAQVDAGVATIRIRGVGSTTAYVIAMPVEFLRQLVEQHDGDQAVDDDATGPLDDLRSDLQAERDELEHGA